MVANVWYQVTAVYTGASASSMKIYVNGVLMSGSWTTIHRGSGLGSGLNLVIDVGKWSSYSNNGATGAYLTSNVTVDTAWHHLVTTNDGTTHKIYVDGVERNSQSKGFVAGTYQAYIGHYDASSQALAWKGLIDDIRVYDRVLSNEEVQLLYSKGH